MVLRATTPQQVPGFEQEDEVDASKVTKVVAAVSGDAAREVKKEIEAGVQATVAIAAAAASSQVAVRAPRREMNDFIGKLENVFPPVEFGESPRLVVASGVFKDADKLVLGAWIEVMVLSWNYTYTVRPGTDEASAKQFVKYSKHKDKFADGTSVPAYLEMLRTTQNLPKATLEEYIEVVGLLLKSDKSYVHTGSQGIVVVSLSPDSVKTFRGMRRDTAVQVMLGSIEPTTEPVVKFVVEARSGNGKDWSRAVASYIKPEAAAV